MLGRMPASALKFRVSSESFSVPLYQPSTERPNRRSCKGDTSIGSTDVAAMSNFQRLESPSTRLVMALLFGDVARMTFALQASTILMQH